MRACRASKLVVYFEEIVVCALPAVRACTHSLCLLARLQDASRNETKLHKVDLQAPVRTSVIRCRLP